MKKYIIFLLAVSVMLSCASCGKTEKAEMPSDFSFSIVWDAYGISSYDSETGKLVKTKDTTDPDKYTSYVTLSEDQMKQVCKFLSKDIDLADYPASYDPFNDPESNTVMTSEPSQTIIVSVTADGETNSVRCQDIAFGSLDMCYCDEAKAFMSSVKNVVSLLTSLPEWEAFPDYERFYE